MFRKISFSSVGELYRKLLQSYALLVIAVMIVSVVGVTYVSIKNTAKTTQNYLRRTSDFALTMEEQSNSLAVELYFSDDAQTLLNYDSSINQKLRSLNAIQESILRDPYIHSVFFYNHKTGRMYIFGYQLMETTREDYPDQEVLDYLLSEETRHGPVCVNLLNSTYIKQRSEVYSSVHHMVDGNALIVNLYASKLFSGYANSLSIENNDFYYIVNDNNELLYSNLSDFTHQEDLSTVISKSRNRIIPFMRIPGVGLMHICTYRQSNMPWSITVLSRWNIVYKELITIVGMFILASCVGFAFISVVNKQVVAAAVKPYYLIQGELDTCSEQEDPNIEVLVQEISNINSSLKEHRTFWKSNIILSQRAFAKRVLLGEIRENNAFYNEARRLELPYEEGRPLVLMYFNWYFCNDNSSMFDDSVQYAICNVLAELCTELCGPVMVSMNGEYHMLLASPSDDYSKINLKEQLKSLHDFFSKYFSLNVFCGVSDLIYDPMQINQIAKNMTSRFFDVQFFDADAYCSFLSEEVIVTYPNKRFFFADSVKLKRAICNGNLDECANLLNAYFDELPLYGYAAVVSSLSLFSSQLVAIFDELASTYPSLVNEQNISHQVVSASTFDIAKKIIWDSVMVNCELIFNDKNVSQREQINKILADLHTMYMDCNLSTKSLAAANHISVETLNRACNQQMGKPIMAYVKEIRLAKSCELLKTTSLSVETIAKRVGFENTKYFHTVFRTMYGTSPQRYRVIQAMGGERDVEQKSNTEDSI